MSYNSSIYREQGTGKFIVSGATRVDAPTGSPETLEELEEKVSQLIGLLSTAGINPPSGGNPNENEYITEVYREQDTGLIRVKGATEITFPASPLTYVDVVGKMNEILSLLEDVGINPAAGETFPDEALNNTTVYQEKGTGKIRVKGAVRIAQYSDSPEALGGAANTCTSIVNLLTDAGINPAS